MDFITDPIEQFYEVGEEIGSGQFAVVKRVVEKISGHEFAAKFIRKRRVASSRRGVPLDDIKREVEVLSVLQHPNIVKLHQVFENSQHVTLVLELVNGGELFDFVSEKERLSEEEASHFIKQILCGLEHMHDNFVAHLDLKPENIMLLSKDSQHIKLIDFGLSRVLTPGCDVRAMQGTPEFVAPEIVSYEPLSLSTDLWAVGVITYILLSGASPFLDDDKQGTYSNIVAGNYCFDEEYFNQTSDLAKDFIAQLFIKDSRKRPSVKDCLCHPWIQPCNSVQEILRKEKEINIDNFKVFQARKRWKLSLQVITLCHRLSRSARLRSQSTELLASSTGPPSSQHTVFSQDENFVVSALLCAAEEGNISGLQELLAMANIDVNKTNKHGETAVHIAAGQAQLEVLALLQAHGANLNVADHQGDTPLFWAARQGQAEVVRLLASAGVLVGAQNKNGETCLHIACRYGHTSVVQQLCVLPIDLDHQDEHAESALHIAAWHGFPQIVQLLCDAHAKLDLLDLEGETALHAASARGHVDSVRCLVDAGASLDLQDRRRSATPLHLALCRHHSHVALLLLHAGADFDLTDWAGDTPLHLAAQEGLLAVTQTLCAFGCSVDVPNKSGLHPLHLASKYGHTEVVRCLCLAGCNIDQKNRDGIKSEITALKQGYNDIGDLLYRLRNIHQREEYIGQLIPTSQPLSRIKVKFFGHSGVGKTTLIDSLKAGYFTSLFRRSKSGTGPTARPNSPSKMQIEMDVTASSRNNSVTFDTYNYQYTKGIEVQHVSVTGSGVFSTWEFSGLENYLLLYDHFLGDASCLHVVVFSLDDPPNVRLQQCCFWLSFLQARIPPVEPLGFCGRPCKAARILLIATHPDSARCPRNQLGEYVSIEMEPLLEQLQQRFGSLFDLYPRAIILDAHVPSSLGMRAFKTYLQESKQQIVQGLPRSTGFLEAVLNWLPGWRRSNPNFPVVSWFQLVQLMHTNVNPLAGEEHMRELVQQLQLMGEAVYLKSPVQDLVVLCPSWLCNHVIGQLLSHDFLIQARVTGCYTVDDFQVAFSECDALDMLQILEALQLCVQCENDGELEYEFPCYNFVETLDGLWDKSDPRYADSVYGGVRLHSPPNTTHLLPCIFPRIQVHLRRAAQNCSDPDSDLYQWYQGSKLCSGLIESLLTLEEEDESIEIKVRGPASMKLSCFYFLEELLGIVDQVLLEMSPGLPLEKHVLSALQLHDHIESVFCWPPGQLMEAMLKEGLQAHLNNPLTGLDEKIIDLIGFGAPEVANVLVPGRKLSVSALSTVARQQLCRTLDPPDPLGRDWCLLAVQLGLGDRIAALECASGTEQPRSQPIMTQPSHTARLLDEWSRTSNTKIGTLIEKLRELNREDGVQVLLRTAPPYRILPAEEESSHNIAEEMGGSHTSSSNLSR